MDGGLFEPDEETDPAVKRAYQSAAELFRRMLVGAGAGTYQFRCAVEGPGGRLTAEARILHWEDGVVRINDEDLDLVVAVLCAGLYRELPGAALLHGTQGSAGACGEYRQVSWAWQSGGTGYRPATAQLEGFGRSRGSASARSADGERPTAGWVTSVSRPAVTFLHPASGQPASSSRTARRASGFSTPQLISCSVRIEGDWS
ncbi:hypothetical protein ACFQ0T_05210 [Kitasatospora gansuensis]